MRFLQGWAPRSFTFRTSRSFPFIFRTKRLFRSFLERNVLFRSFFEFLATYETQKNDAFISVHFQLTEMNAVNEMFIFNERK